MKALNHMYEQNRKSLNAYVGCEHGCVYCKPSFQRQMKRQRCELCKSYTPHFHPERLLKAPPRTQGDGFIFFPSSADLAFASRSEVQAHIDYAEKYLDRTFLIQSKAPAFMQKHKFPSNVVLATTLETNLSLYETPSKYKSYKEISSAPHPFWRFLDMLNIGHSRLIVTVEPILQFTMLLAQWIKEIGPEAVYVGYDNHNCKLPEPRLNKTLELIERLERFTEVRRKTLRKAWWEP